MQKSHNVELTYTNRKFVTSTAKYLTGGRATFVDEQGKAMIVDFKQKHTDGGSSASSTEEETMYMNIYEFSPAEYKSFRLVKKLSSAGADKLLKLSKPIEHLEKQFYYCYDTLGPGGHYETGHEDFATNIKNETYKTNSEAANKLIRQAQDLIFDKIQEVKQAEKVKQEQQKQAEIADKNQKFGNFISKERE